jgi:hypothetical protein
VADNGNPVQQAIGWLKGRMRPEIQASECVHLVLQHTVRVNQVQMEARVAGPTGEKAKQTVLAFDGLPRLEVACRSPEMIGRLRTMAKLPPALDQQYTTVRVSLTICRLCPFFERPQ